MSVTLERRGATIAVIDPIRRRIAELRAQLPPAVRAMAEELARLQADLRRSG